ncbi:MAG: hypothetical protein ACRBBO_09070 [Cognatishimia sp.]
MLRGLAELLEAMFAPILEFIGIETGKFLLGEFFIVLLLSSLIVIPITAAIHDSACENMNVKHGGFGYYILALILVICPWVAISAGILSLFS